MKTRNILTFILAVGISLFGAAYRWGDSAHSIGIIKARGGEARHPSVLTSGENRYMLISTATVIPPFKGNARVALEGTPEMDYRIYFSEPVIDLGVRRLPKFSGNVIYGLEPFDRIALWVDMKPPVLDPVCGMQPSNNSLTYSYGGKKYLFCSEGCRDTFVENPGLFMNGTNLTGEYTLAFYDTDTGNSLLRVPLIFKGKGEKTDAGEHHH